MIKRTISYEDFLGNQRTEDFYFHMTDKELADFIASSGGYTLDKQMEKMVRTGNLEGIMKIVEKIIDMSYGEISLDGRRFDKSEEILNNFKRTPAYSVFYMELLNSEEKQMEFIRGVVSRQTLERMTKAEKENPGLFDEINKMKASIPTPAAIPMADKEN